MPGLCLLLVVLVLLVFAQCVRFEFVNYDDYTFVLKNEHVLRGLTWENGRWALTAGMGTNTADIDYWRPLSVMSHMLDVQWFGLKPSAHHAVSVGLHALTAVALLLVLQSMTGMLWRSAFVAAVFAIHPLHVESVAWVAERKDVLSGLFFVLTLGAYTRYVRRPFHVGNYLLVLLLFVLGVMSKPMLVTLPCVLLLLDYWPLNRAGTAPVTRLLMEKAPFFIISLAAAVVTKQGPGCIPEETLATLPWYWCMANGLVSYGIYLVQTVCPTGLACFYPHPGRSLALGSLGFALVVLGAITVGVLHASGRRYLTVGWLWYLGMLVPVIGFIQAGNQRHADRYTYLSMIGLSLMVAWAAADWAGDRRSRRVALGSVAVVVLCVLMVAAHQQTSYWRDSRTLWTHAIECTSNNALAYNNLGSTLIEKGQPELALASYRQSLAIKPDDAGARFNLGVTLFQQGQFDEAILQLQQTVASDPQLADAHTSLALALLQKGELNSAIAHFHQTVNIRPDAAAHRNLGNALLQAGQVQDAIASYQRGIDVSPRDAETHFSLGMTYLRMGQVKTAVVQFQKVLENNPAHLPALNNLAWLLATSNEDALRNGPQAVALAERAIQTPSGNNPFLLHTLAAAYAETGQFEKAAQTAQHAAEMAATQGTNALAEQIRAARHRYLSGAPLRDVR